MYCPTRATVAAYTTIRRERRIPAPAEILVNTGEQVEPTDIVARGVKPRQPGVIDVAKALAVSTQQADQYIQTEVGSTIRAGETIAAKKGAIGILGKTCRAPFDGLVIAITQGKVLVQPQATETTGELEFPALLRGKVSQVIPGRGVVLESEAGLVQGVWGWGAQSVGILKTLVDSPDEPLTTASIDATSQGCILVAGMLSDQAALLRAAEVKVSGVVVGSMRANLSDLSSRIQFPLVVTEGFGQIPMSDLVFGLLKSYEREMAYISGPIQDVQSQMQPEIAIFPAARGQLIPIKESTMVEKGAIVRITREPYTGKIGTLRSFSEKRRMIESGLVAQCAEIELREQQNVWVPVANLEKVQ